MLRVKKLMRRNIIVKGKLWSLVQSARQYNMKSNDMPPVMKKPACRMLLFRMPKEKCGEGRRK